MPYRDKEKKKEYMEKWLAANKEQVKERKKEYYEATKDKPEVKERIKKYKKEWNQANEERNKEQRKIWWAANGKKEEVKEQRKTYRVENKEHLKENSKEWIENNKDKVRQTRKDWCDRNRDKLRENSRKRTPEQRRKQKLWMRYRLTPVEYGELLNKTGGKCPVCGVKFDNKTYRPCIDHCHRTDKIRGILCARCNLGIGMFYENTEAMENAAAYLRQSNQNAG